MRTTLRSVTAATLLMITGVSHADEPITAAALLKQMTLEEKAGQLAQVFYIGGSKAVEESVRKGQVGSIALASNPKTLNRLQHLAVEQSRLHIPLLIGFDVIHGLQTIFPVPIGMAASWDPAMVEAAQSIAANEARAAGVHWAFAPMVDIARDPRWGRMVEGAGEDPYLGAAMAVAQTRGFQGGRTVQPGHIIAGPKHFAGYGASLGGRDYDEVNLSNAELWNVYLPPFKAAVEAGAGNIMSAYMSLNGVPGAANRWLLDDVLRNTWKFDGFVVSDANGVRNLVAQGVAADAPDAATRALTAGVDLEMSVMPNPMYAELVTAVKSGRLAESVLDTAVLRLLQAKIDLGLFKNPYVDEAQAERTLRAPEHRVQARIAAERAAVLLKNDGQLLPLSRDKLRSIAVVGPFAESQRDLLGPWVFAYNLAETSSIAAGVREAAGTAIRVDVAAGVPIPTRKFPSPFTALDSAPRPKPWSAEQSKAEWSKAQTVAANADVIVLTLGQNWEMSGEVASSSSLALPAEQLRLLDAMVATGKPVVAVLINGRPLDLSDVVKRVPAILEAWYPGTQGGAAVANLLFGDAVPGGKLPFTWPRNAGQVPLIYSHLISHDPKNANKRYWNEDGSPLFSFGYGLSYTTFAISEPRLDVKSIRIGESIKVVVDVKNTGAQRGDEVVQLYIHQRSGRSARPIRELKGFQRVALAPNESKTVTFTLSPNELQYWSDSDHAWGQDAASFDVWVGADVTATAHAQFEVVR